MKHISEQTRNDIISLLNENLSLRKISPKVGVNIGTVSRACNRLKRQDITNRGGRSGKLSQQDRRMVMSLVASGKVDNPVQVAKELNTYINNHISVQTMKITLKNMVMKAVVKKKNLFLSARYKLQRLYFALQHQYWNIDNTKRVIWSDETKINRLGPDGRKWVWRTTNEALQERLVQGTMKYHGGNLMIWGYMTYQGVGFACRRH